ncbi:Pimeloyl-ACP methyl ester carboxylesterase [Alcanivorax sp. DSM 26293]|uniref:alpha/beta fold hydrolase n=1 Tax=Alcanivorax sp. DSM 26293 TaxID=1798238 RepID=UPI00089FDBDD|nr:alpha/beta hydrolase [Alcanivorax sp. DSM 26293]SEF87708.1 Pimeloyl-ACP methyl ester carboxylesterase [Alcanivorax sp. DSM 26293]
MHPHDIPTKLNLNASSFSAESGRDIQFLGNGGLVLRATQFGDPQSPQVLLLHGGGQTRHAWAHTATALARAGYCATCIDARGHGQSQWCPEGNYSASALVTDLRAIIESLPSSPYIVGASMGGLTAMLALGEEPPLDCRGLVLVDVAPRLETKGVRRVIEFMRRHPDGFDTLSQVQDAVAAYNPTRKAPSNAQGLRKNLRQDANGRLHWHWDPAFLDHAVIPEGDEGMFCRARLNRAASRLKLPILLIRGHHSDVLSEAGAQELLALVPHAKYRVIGQAGHMVAGDRNSIFTGAVLDFLQHLDPQCIHIRSTDRRLTP